MAQGAVPAFEETAEAPPEDGTDAGTQPEEAVPAGHSLAVILNGKNVVLPPKGGAPYYLFDMLSLVDIDPQNPKGTLRILVNGAEAAYQKELVAGDKIEIGWEGEQSPV